MSRMTLKRDIVVEQAGELKESSKGNVLKFGITSPLREGDKGELVFLRPEQPLSDAIAQVCQVWGFPDPSIFALKFNDPPCHYVTETTRKDISGKLVSMQHSPIKLCQDILDKCRSGHGGSVDAGLQELAEKASDPTVADVFVTSVDGLTTLIELIEKDKLPEKPLSAALQALLDIMLHSTHATWDKLQPSVISRVAGYVNSRGQAQDRLALGAALQVLESVVTSGTAHSQVEREITLPSLMKHIENQDASVQQNVLSLINALLSKADSNKRKHLTGTLSTRNYRDKIIHFVIKREGENRPVETNHQLYVLQTLMLNSLDSRRNIPVDPQQDADYQESLSKIKDLCKIAFDSDSGTLNFGSSMDLNGGTNTKREKPNFSRDYKRLGFQNDINPALDFSVIPPGILALDCLHYLASNHTETYNKIILETASRGVGDECPFARSAIALTALLCDILRVGDPPGDHQGKFYPFFFQFERPFEELFCVCVTLVTKTWKDMRATVEDFDKVFDVVREQITRALERVPESLQFTELRQELNRLTYTEITNLRAKERTEDLQAKPILELRKKLVPGMMELIKQNRLNYLISGTRFNRYAQKGLVRVKEKFWFCRLSPNGKFLHYGDCEEKATPTPEELSSKVSVNDLQDLLVGKDCQHVKDKKKANSALAFSLVTERDPLQSIDFIAPDEKTFDMWTDGINALLGKEMVSKEAKSDLDILLNMEIKLRLLDLEGVPEIPQDPPPIPELPSDLDFSAFINTK